MLGASRSDPAYAPDPALDAPRSVAPSPLQTFLLILGVLFLGAAITAAYLRFGQAFLWVAGAVLAVLAVILLAGIVLLDGFGRGLLDALTMGWGPWMAVIAVIGAASAGIWLLLVRRTQTR